MRVTDDIQKCVVFIGQNIPSTIPGGPVTPHYEGTGFIVRVGNHALGFDYLVTAAHVAEKLKQQSFWLSMNSIDGKTIVKTFHALKWEVHPDDSMIDLAICPIALGSDTTVAFISESLLIKAEELAPKGIGIGDEIFMTGFFHYVHTPFQHKQIIDEEDDIRLLPILRMGNIAMLPQHQIPTGRGLKDLYLIEAHSLGGISGSPVFVAETLRIPVSVKGEIRYMQGPGNFYLLGLCVGHWDIDPSDLQTIEPKKAKAGEGVNVGIAMVVPAQKILDILHGTEFTQMRRQQIQKQYEAELEAVMPIEDSAPHDPSPFEKFQEGLRMGLSAPKDAVKKSMEEEKRKKN